MAYGLEIYNSSGTPTITATNRITRYISSMSYTPPGARGVYNISVASITPDYWFVFCEALYYIDVKVGSIDVYVYDTSTTSTTLHFFMY